MGPIKDKEHDPYPHDHFDLWLHLPGLDRVGSCVWHLHSFQITKGIKAATFGANYLKFNWPKLQENIFQTCNNIGIF